MLELSMLEEKNVVVSSGEECLDGCQPIMLTSAAGKGMKNCSWMEMERLIENKLASLEATLVRNYDPPTDRVTHRGEVKSYQRS